MGKPSFAKKKISLLKEEKQLNFFMNDMLKLKNNELKKTKTELNETKLIHNQTSSKLFDIQQQNQFLKDIRLILDSKVKTLEQSSAKLTFKIPKNTKTNTDRMFYDQQMPLLSINSSIKSSRSSLDGNFDKQWLKNFKQLEDSVLLTKLQIEEIVDYTEKESLT